jgi:adenine-specific DNA-methyltransferase
MNHYKGDVLDYKKSIALYALFQSCLIKRPFNLFHRKNLEIRTKDVIRNFGNKTTWERPFENYFKHFINEANDIIFDSNIPCKSINESILNIKETNFDLIYLDPPYLNHECKNETANYLKCYHFLEGIVNYPKWNDLIDFNSINLRLKNVDTENDFQRDSIYNTLDQILETFKNSKIVFSYKKGGKPSIEWLVARIKRHKKKVYTRSLHYHYALNRQNGDAHKNREVLIFGI